MGNHSQILSPIRLPRTAEELGFASSVAPWAIASTIGSEWNQARVARPTNPTSRFSSRTIHRVAIVARVSEAVLSKRAVSATLCYCNNGTVTSKTPGLTVSVFIGWRDAMAAPSPGPRWHSRANTPPKSWVWQTIKRRRWDRTPGRSASPRDCHRTHPRRESSKPDRRRIRSNCRGHILTQRKRIGTWNKRGSQWNLPIRDCTHLTKGCKVHDSPSKTLEYPMRRRWIWDMHLGAHLHHNLPYHHNRKVTIFYELF